MVVKSGKLWPALEQFGEGYSILESKPHHPVCGRATSSISTISHECSVDSDHSLLVHVCRTGARERLFWFRPDTCDTLHSEKALAL